MHLKAFWYFLKVERKSFGFPNATLNGLNKAKNLINFSLNQRKTILKHGVIQNEISQD